MNKVFEIDNINKVIEEYKELINHCEEELLKNCGIPKALFEEKEEKMKKFTIFNIKYLVNSKI